MYPVHAQPTVDCMQITVACKFKLANNLTSKAADSSRTPS